MGVRLQWIEALLPASVLAAQAVVDLVPGSALVYRLTSPAGKAYIGVTRDIAQRLWCHPLRSLHIGNSIRKYGVATHLIEVLAVLPAEEAYALEARAIKAFGTLSPNGMNLDEGGLGFRPLSEESSEKKRRALRKPKSPEHRAALSAAKIGKRMPPSFIEKQRQRVVTDTTRAKISAAKKGVPKSAETRERMRLGALLRWGRQKQAAAG